ncbi:uncharacterized protein CDAR_547121 [Caerostris darwini]|uniref:Uncharacterized protein n=1 Tax=Caerostris darwini TaxID=1538125 RepID=A0AAV4PPY9_9ARAC|nr:uncharacterized protein CDAR_547121 [Caerostris darwini]
MAAENIVTELSWICALLFLVVGIMLVITCVCFKHNEKSPEYGTAGRLSITRDSPIFHHQPRNGTISSSSKQSDLNSEDACTRLAYFKRTPEILDTHIAKNPYLEIGGNWSNWKEVKSELVEIGNYYRNGVLFALDQTHCLETALHSIMINSWTVKDRALPELPGAAFIQIDGENISNVAATADQVKIKTHNKAQAPKPPGNDPSKVFPMNGSAPFPIADTNSGVTVTITVNDKTQIIGNNTSMSERASKSRIPVVDSLCGTSNSMVLLKKVEKVETADNSAKPGPSTDNFYDIPDNPNDKGSQSTSMSSSPVCIKIMGSAASSDDGNSSTLSASLAVAGAVPSSDIPYMTPPLHHNLPPPIMTEEVGTTVTGGRSEVPYTVISVREPLARVREITMRRQRAAVTQQNSEENEDHYAMVPEEEQMYAEIGSGHDSGSSSITYAHIEPRQLPPVPPTVESLKSVAHAHSRQASTVSTSSIGSCLSGSGDSSPPQLRNPSTSLYSTVDKSNSKQRKTIHVAEGVSLVTTAEKRKKVEDLYAKVRKKRVELTIGTPGSDEGYQGIHDSNSETMTPPPSPWASTTPPAPPPIIGRIQAASLSVLLPGGSQHVRRHSADPNLPEIINENRVFTGSTRSSVVSSSKDPTEPDYEKIYNENNSGDSCYEKIKEEGDSNGSNGESVWHSGPSNLTYPGYESVKDPNEDDDSLDPNYECVAQGDSENDPGYEPVRVSGNFDDSDSNSDYTVVKSDDCRDVGYERVKNLGRSESDAADPGYEKIKNLPRAGSDATDPGYERVRNKLEDVTEPGYETVQRSDSDTDPGYEVVHQSRSFNSRYATDSSLRRPVTRDSNSTVLFVPGSSNSHVSNSSDIHDQVQSSGSNEPTATFL